MSSGCCRWRSASISLADALATLARGDAVLPLRQMVWQPDKRGMIGVMPGYLGSPARFGLKIVSIFPATPAPAYDSHQGAVLIVRSARSAARWR